jgi:hypothetical protein
MTEVTEEIESAITALGLSRQVFRLSAEEEKRRYAAFVSEFLGGKDRHWWWEAFTKPEASVSFPDDMGFKYVPQLVPSATEPCWFMVEDSSSTYPIYLATPEQASRIIGECFAFEYYLIAQDMRWLICENHHGRVIGLGTEVVEAINQAAHGKSSIHSVPQ